MPRNVVGAEGFGQVLPRFFTTRQQSGLAQAVFQAFTTTFQRLVDGFGAGGEAALQHSKGEADVVFFLPVEVVGAVHFFADVGGDVFV